MSLVTIVAESAAEALAEVHRRLGPSAVVVNVRKMSAPGLSRMWKKPQIEIQATVPVPTRSQPQKQALADLAKSVDRLKQQLSAPAQPTPKRRQTHRETEPEGDARARVKWVDPPQKSATSLPPEEVGLTRMLENLGLLPLHAQWLADQVSASSAGHNRANLREQFGAVQDFLLEYWKRTEAMTLAIGSATRILVGTPGVGKTTCLCKWLTQEVLLQGRTARVWRLDSDRANTAEFLSIHGEILNVPVERVWTAEAAVEAPQVQFVDLPGVPADDAIGVASLAKQIKAFDSVQVYLVLNAAYDLNHLLAHCRAFSQLPLGGLILAHTDEENRWSKFWNLLLGTKLPVLFLSGGQNIPGYFAAASPQSLFDISSERAFDQP